MALVGLLPGKALVVMDGGKRQTIVVGQTTAEGVKLLSLASGSATFEIDGKQRLIRIGQSVVSQVGEGRSTTVLMADPRGHFVTQGSINGSTMRFLVDTGATVVSLGAADAKRARIDPLKGQAGMTMTANGPARVWRVKLDNLRLGNISLSGVDAAVHEQDMPMVLLGMSFLNRMEMTRDGPSLTLTKRY